MTADEFAAVEQARALLARPAQASLLRTRAFPSGMRMLLRVAANDEAAVRLAAERTGDSPAALHEACVFYVQQLLLDEASDSYRVLGVESMSPIADIKAHYGLLMRWMHPDRNPDAWEVVFAERVNRAWNDLRTVDRRGAYDRILATEPEPDAASEDWTGRAAPFRPYPVRVEPLRTSTISYKEDIPSPVSKPAPKQWLGAAAAAGLAAMVLFVAWPSRNAEEGEGPTAATRVERPDRSEKGLATAPQTADSPNSTSSASRGSATRGTPPTIAEFENASALSNAAQRPGISAPEFVAAQPPLREVPIVPATRAGEPAREAADPGVSSAATTGTAVGAKSRAERELIAAAPTPVEQVAAPSVAATATSEQPLATSMVAQQPSASRSNPILAVAAAPAVQAPDLDQASLLIGRFAHAYQKGDTAALASLFTADASSQGRGLEQIRAAYDRQFARTSQRSISIRDIKWRVEDERALATGRFEILQAIPGKQDKNSVSRGTIRFDIEQHQDRVLISRLEHVERRL